MRSLKQLWKQKNIELTQTLDKVFETLTWAERGKMFLVVSNPPCCKNDATTLIIANANTKSNMPWFRSLHDTSGKKFFKTSWKFWTSLRIQILNHFEKRKWDWCIIPDTANYPSSRQSLYWILQKYFNKLSITLRTILCKHKQ